MRSAATQTRYTSKCEPVLRVPPPFDAWMIYDAVKWRSTTMTG